MAEAEAPNHAVPQKIDCVLLIEDCDASAIRLQNLVRQAGAGGACIHHARDIAEARQWLTREIFDLAFVDLGLPDGNGLELIYWLAQHHKSVCSVVVSSWRGQDTILEALRAGAEGYLLKERDDQELLFMLRSIRNGGAPIDPFMAKQILEHVGGHGRSLHDKTSSAAPEVQDAGREPVDETERLSARQLEILGLVSQGLSNREVADRLSLSVLTVEVHTKAVYRKLAVRSRTEAIYQARLRGWLV